MNTGDSLLEILFICLLATALAVPGAQKLGLGRALGYLVAGILIGPWGLAVIREPVELRLLSEVATGMLLFLIGLQLQPTPLQRLRTEILYQGFPFWFISALLFFLVGLSTGLGWPAALAVALALAFSSDTMVGEFIEMKNLGTTSRGASAFAITSSQALMFLPLLILVPLLGFGNPLQDSVGLQSVLLDIVISVAVVGLGHLLLKHLLRYITATQSPELFLAAVLLMLTGVVLLFIKLGSSALPGAFLAGCLMAASEFRRELVSTLRPWRGLLLGFFFLTMGVSVDFGLFLRYPHIVIPVLVVMLFIKFAVALSLDYLRSNKESPHFLTAMLVAPAGELSFVMLSVAVAYQAVDRELGSGLMVVVALSMALTPVLQMMYRRSRERDNSNDHHHGERGGDRPARPLSAVFNNAKEAPIVIAGFGRIGQTVCRLLVSAGMQPVLIDHDPERLAEATQLGFRTWCGDALRHDLLQQAGLDNMKTLVVAVDDRERSMQLVEMVQEKFPHITLVVRSADRYHQVELACAGVENSHRENFESAVLIGEDALAAIGIDWEETERISEAFRDHETRLIESEIAQGRENIASGEPSFSPSLSLGYSQVDNGLQELLSLDNAAFEEETRQRNVDAE